MDLNSNLYRVGLPVATQLIGSVYGNKAIGNATGEAAGIQRNAAGDIVNAANDMYSQTRTDLAPYTGVGKNAAGKIPSLWDTPNQTAYDYNSRLQDVHGQYGNISAPNLNSSVNFNLANDPLYASQLTETTNALNRRLAASGQFNSSDADNAILRNTSSLLEGVYNRQLGDLERANTNAMTMYGYDVDTYNRNRQNVMDQYGIQNKADTDVYNRVSDSVNTGLTANQTQANAGNNAVSSIADAYKYSADAGAQAALLSGMSDAQLANTIGQLPAAAYSLYEAGSGSGLLSGGSNAATGVGAAGAGAAGLGAVAPTSAAVNAGAMTGAEAGMLSNAGLGYTAAGGTGATGAAGTAGSVGSAGAGTGASTSLAAASPYIGAAGMAVIAAAGYDAWRKNKGTTSYGPDTILRAAEAVQKGEDYILPNGQKAEVKDGRYLYDPHATESITGGTPVYYDLKNPEMLEAARRHYLKINPHKKSAYDKSDANTYTQGLYAIGQNGARSSIGTNVDVSGKTADEIDKIVSDYNANQLASFEELQKAVSMI